MSKFSPAVRDVVFNYLACARMFIWNPKAGPDWNNQAELDLAVDVLLRMLNGELGYHYTAEDILSVE
jgi:hypothetical protein